MILIGTDDGIYRWFEGLGWPIFHSLQYHAVVGLAAPGAGVLAALDRTGQVFESVNNGQDWHQVALPAEFGAPTALSAWDSPAQIVLAGRSPSLYRRVVGTPQPQYDEPAPVGMGIGATLWGRARTLAGGATAMVAPRSGVRTVRADRETARLAGWNRLGFPGKGEVRLLATGPGTPGSWFASVGSAGLWRSTNLGTSWQQCPGLPAQVLALRSAPGRLYAATSDGCWTSADDGQTWEDRSGGLENARYLSAIEVKPGAPDVLLCGAAPKAPDTSSAAPFQGHGFSLYESNNGGKTWTHARRGNPDVLQFDTIADIRHDPAAPENIVMAFGSGELWVTRNAGAFWMPLARQIRAARVLCAAG